MSEQDRGPLIASFEDGTQIYRNGVLTSRGFFDLNIGIYNFRVPDRGSVNPPALAGMGSWRRCM